MRKEIFGGAKKEGEWLLLKYENKLRAKLWPLVPLWVHTYHLTLCTIPISIGVALFSYLATWNINWLWVVSLLLIAQWITDMLDGDVGRNRNEGFVKWGYYMDHFLDYVFLCSILIGYMLLLPDQHKFLHFFVFAIFVGFMINSYLGMATLNKFSISYLKIGPTEIRLLFVIINTLLILFGKTYITPLLPYVLVFSFVGLCVVIYQTQKVIWDLDMRNKFHNIKNKK